MKHKGSSPTPQKPMIAPYPGHILTIHSGLLCHIWQQAH